MIEIRQIARRYATALFEVARAEKAQDATLDVLSSLAKAHSESDVLALACSSPILSADDRHQAVALIAKQVNMSPLMQRFLETLAVHNRLNLLEPIAQAFAELVRTDRGAMSAEVISAGKLAEKDYRLLERSLTDAAGREVVLDRTEDPSIIAGVKIRMGSYELDASLKGKLTKAAQQLHEAVAPLSS